MERFYFLVLLLLKPHVSNAVLNNYPAIGKHYSEDSAKVKTKEL